MGEERYYLVDLDAIKFVDGKWWHWTPEDGWEEVSSPEEGEGRRGKQTRLRERAPYKAGRQC